MKTLDEVITGLEYCLGDDGGFCEGCPSFSVPDCMVQSDALHYLKEYQRVRSQPNSCCIDDYDKPMWNPKEHWE